MLSEQRNPCTDCKSAHQCTNRENLLLFPKLHLGPCSSVGVQRGTDTQTGMNNIHFASSMTHVKCNHSPKNSCCGMEVVDLTPEHSVSCIMAEKIVVSVTTEFMTLQLRWQLTVVTLTLNALGDKTPEKIGTKSHQCGPLNVCSYKTHSNQGSMMMTTIATTIAIALLNIRDDKKRCRWSYTTNTNCTHETGSLIAEFASQGPNYSSATEVLPKWFFSTIVIKCQHFFRTFSAPMSNFKTFQGLIFLSSFFRTLQDFSGPVGTKLKHETCNSTNTAVSVSMSN